MQVWQDLKHGIKGHEFQLLPINSKKKKKYHLLCKSSVSVPWIKTKLWLYPTNEIFKAIWKYHLSISVGDYF